MEFTRQPLSRTRVRHLSFSSSIAQARPVGPAPITMASKSVTGLSQSRFYRLMDRFQSMGERGCILSAAFRHIGTAGAFATDGLGDLTDELAGLDFAG